jgi:hypothetical protein
VDDAWAAIGGANESTGGEEMAGLIGGGGSTCGGGWSDEIGAGGGIEGPEAAAAKRWESRASYRAFACGSSRQSLAAVNSFNSDCV